MRKYRSFGEMNLKYGILSETKKKKVTANFQQNFFQNITRNLSAKHYKKS
jgi:hypothetical protein